MRDSFLTIDTFSISELRINKSKFISQAFPLQSPAEISDILKATRKKYFDASHHPYAYRLGLDKNNFKASDDGEPQGSSGKPVLETIDKFNLTDVLVIVTRYFGGIKLGTGGLRRAYFDSAESCLSKAMVIEKLITKKINLEFDYKFMNTVMNLIESEHAEIVQNNSDEKCKLMVEARISRIEYLKQSLINVTNNNVLIE